MWVEQVGICDVFPRTSRCVAEMQGNLPCSAPVIRAVLPWVPITE